MSPYCPSRQDSQSGTSIVCTAAYEVTTGIPTRSTPVQTHGPSGIDWPKPIPARDLTPNPTPYERILNSTLTATCSQGYDPSGTRPTYGHNVGGYQ